MTLSDGKVHLTVEQRLLPVLVDIGIVEMLLGGLNWLGIIARDLVHVIGRAETVGFSVVIRVARFAVDCSIHSSVNDLMI